LLTDGKSRNTGARWSHSGRTLAYSSTRRNGAITTSISSIHPIPKPTAPCLQLDGAAGTFADWSSDDSKMVLVEYISANESYLWHADVNTGKKSCSLPKAAKKSPTATRVSPTMASRSTSSATKIRNSNNSPASISPQKNHPLTSHIKWDVEDVDLSARRNTIAFLVNEDAWASCIV